MINTLINHKELKEAKEYWIEHLKESVSKTKFPYTFERNSLYTQNKFEYIDFCFDSDTTRSIKNISNDSENRLFIILVVGLIVLLRKYTNDDDIKIGVPIYSQPTSENFINTILTIRTTFSNNDIFKELLFKVRELLINADKYQNYPIEKIIYNLRHSFDDKQIPFFDIIAFLDGLQREQYIDEYRTNIIFKFIDKSNEIKFEIAYNSKLYSQAYIKSIAANYTYLVKNLITNFDTNINQIEYISKAEVYKLIEDFNDTLCDFNSKSIADNLMESFNHYKNNKAIVDVKGNTIQYHQLKNKYLNFCNILREKYGIKPGDRVGVIEKDTEAWVVAFISILSVGAVYVPINPSYPKERISFIIKNSKIGYLVTNNKFDYSEFDHLKKIIYTNEQFDHLGENLNKDFKPLKIDPNLPAYIIYTSGSTGNPKGIEMPYRCINNLMNWQINKTEIEKELKTLQFASVSFDVSVQETLFCLLTGGCLHLINDETRQDISALDKFIAKNNLELIFLPFSALNALFQYGNQILNIQSIKHIVTAGETLIIKENLKTFMKKNPNVFIHNHYGPSETHVVTCSSFCYDSFDFSLYPSIGKPICNSYIYILDKNLNLVPIGAEGEIFIGGNQLALGYLDNELSESKFLPNPFKEDSIIYKTGDIGKWKENGDIEFIKRIDDQVKIRGFRVELEEIRSNLITFPGIKDCLVLVRQSFSDDYKELIAYITTNNNIEIGSSDIRNFLNAKLPYYMIPSDFITIDKFPININGKVDKKVLLEMRSSKSNKYVPPKTEVEKKITAIWEEVLNKDKISIDDDIVELGGNSISVVILISKIKSLFKIDLLMKDVFQLSTIRNISKQIENNSITLDLLIELNKIKPNKEYLYFIPPVIGSSTIFKSVALAIEQKYNCFGLQYKGFDYEIPFDNSILEMSNTFIDYVLNIQKNGVFNIVGFSMGAFIAFEISKILEDKGFKVNLILIDKNLEVNYKVEKNLFDSEFENLTKNFQLEVDILLNAKDRIYKLYEHNLKILSEYSLKGIIKGNIFALEALENEVSTKMEIWNNYTAGKFKHVYISGKHSTILNNNNINELVNFLNNLNS